VVKKSNAIPIIRSKKCVEMTRVAVIAHDVKTPLVEHKSIEFSQRMYFMAKRYDEVHLISRDRTAAAGNSVPIRDEFSPNLTVHRIRSDLVSSNLEILRIATAVGIDVIFADAIDHGAAAMLTKKRKGIPLVTFVQGYEADLRAIGAKLRLGLKPTIGLLSKIFAVQDQIILRASDRVLCVSSGLAQYYARALLPKKAWGKIEVIPHSLQYVELISEDAKLWADRILDSIRARNGQRTLLIAVVGIGSSKGTEVALKAFKFMATENPNIMMVLFGKTIDQKYVRMVKSLGLQKQTLIFESLARDKLLALLSRSSIFLLPSFSEGFCLAVTEAMALRIPVVAYSSKPLMDPLSKGAILGIRTADPKEYAGACLSLFENEKFASTLVKRGADYVRPFCCFSEKNRLELICDNIDQVISRNVSRKCS
jgi:glycosyltransferase involved in cell wall biosynthesis